MDAQDDEDEFDADDPNAPWKRDPVDGLPAVIEPGRIAMEFWWRDHFNGEHVLYDFIFYWHGGQEAEWFYDISMRNPGLSPMSSAPIGGSATWEDGVDVLVTVKSDDFDLDEEVMLPGSAPNNDSIGAPRTWVDLGYEIARVAEGFLE